jgi:hypothetical protein
MEEYQYARHQQAPPRRPVAEETSCRREKMGHLAHLEASSPACMAKYLLKRRISKILSKRQNEP